jgi:serine/threonine protein kinase
VRRGERVALATGSLVGGFEILGVIGSGGFSIVYLARDPVLDRRVALKEYLPSHLAERAPDGSVVLREFAHAPLFEQGLETFMHEARLLARFEHPSLLRVHRFWRERGTAYMAMPYLEGRTLLAARQAMPRPPDEAWLRSVLGPLLEAVQTLHEASCFHRDISPDNILLLPSGTPVLLDFGSARTIRGDGSQQLTAVLKPAYAPIEQYAESPQLRQGPWTDLYAWGAVARFCITGRPPTPATVRAVEDLLRPLAAEVRAMARSVPGLRYSPTLLTAIDWALALRPADRPQSVAQLRPLLDGRRSAPPPREERPESGPHATQPLAASGTGMPWAAAPRSEEEVEEHRRVGAFAGDPSAGVPRFTPSGRSWRAPAGIAAGFFALLAAAGWRVADQHAAEQSLDRMARSASAAPAGAARAAGTPSAAALPPGVASPGGGATRSLAAGVPTGVPMGGTGSAPAAILPAGASPTTAAGARVAAEDPRTTPSGDGTPGAEAPALVPRPLPAGATATLKPVAARSSLSDGMPDPASLAPSAAGLAAPARPDGGSGPAGFDGARATGAAVAAGVATASTAADDPAAVDPAGATDPLATLADPALPAATAAGGPGAASDAPLEEILDEPVRDVAPRPSSPALHGTPALLAPARSQAAQPAGRTAAQAALARGARPVRAPRTEPALNDAVPDRRATPASAKQAARDRGPRDYCARQERYTDYFCMKRQCELPRFRNARECMALRREGWWGFMREHWRTASR